MRRDYVEITRVELEKWLKKNFGSWSRDTSKAGIYFIHLSDRVAVKLSSTQKATDSAVARGRASMNLSLVSLIDGSLLNRKARDRKYFQRTKNWEQTWKKGVDHWIDVYEAKADFYEKIADREGYKSRWLGLIDALPSGGSDAQIIKSRETVMKGSVLWANQEQYILDLAKQSKGRRVNPQLTQPLPVELLRNMWREANRRSDRDSMESLKTLGLAASRNETPSLSDVVEFKSLKKRLGF